MKNEKNNKQDIPVQKRRFARLAALQCLYQYELGVKRDFSQHLRRFTAEFFKKDEFKVLNYEGELESYQQIDLEHFVQLTERVRFYQTEIDKILEQHLSDQWRIDRIEKVILIIFRMAIFELYYCEDIPKNVSVSEYVNLTSIYYEEKEPAFVNKVLDIMNPDN